MDWKNTALTTTRQINKGQIRGKIQVKVHFPGIIRMNAQNTNVSTTTVQQRYQQMMACRTTSVCLGATAMTHGNSSKMGHWLGAANTPGRDTLSREEKH